jgi:hypothetical protein
MDCQTFACSTALIAMGLLMTASTGAAATMPASKPADRDAFVCVSPRDPRYFELTNGTAYVPIGFNLVDAPQEKEWPEVLATMAANKVNYCRVFLDAPPWKVEKRKSGQYDADDVEVLVRFLKAAGRHGIRVKTCLEHFRDVQPQPADAPPPKDHWAQRPYHHRDNGGPFASMEEYLSTEQGIAQFKRKLAFYQAHCGDRPEVFAWELWNEMDCVHGDWLAWTKRMLPEAHRLFPKNLIVQSLGSFDSPAKRDANYRPTVTLAGNDVAQVHRYLDLGCGWEICHGPIDVMLADAVRELRAMTADKPILVAETGAVKPKHTGCSELYEKDKAGMILHDVIFAPFFAGAAGPGHAWWWRQSVQQPNQWHHFARFAAAIEGIDPPAEGFEAVTIQHPRLRVYALKGKTTFLAWCRDRRNDWRTELEEGKPPEVIAEAIVDFGDHLAGTVAAARTYDPCKDIWSSTRVESGKVALPAFQRSIVVRLASRPR